MQNARYEEQLKELTENLDLLIVENEEKDKLIQSLELDLKEKSHHTEHLKMGAIMASQEADQLQRIANEREAKLIQIKLEKEMKENEAAAHLKMVEEKAKRVDQLESQMVLLNMDKDKLKIELGRLTDQLMTQLDNVAENSFNPKT